MNRAVGGVLSFERFSLDLTRGCLRAGEQDIELRPKAFEVLRYLAENAGRLVAKEELHEAVWPNVIVSDGSIVQCIRELRSKLGDVDHSLIKTVSRRGYLLDVTDSAGAPQRLPDGPAAMRPRAPQTQLGSQQRVSAIPSYKLGMWAAVAAVLLSAAWWGTYLAGRYPAKLGAQPKLETPQTAGQFDGTWRVEFFNNEFCFEQRRTGFWIIRQGIVRIGGASTTNGTVSGTGELQVTWPALLNPTRTSAGSAKLQGGRGEGRWGGTRDCGGTFTLMRISSG